MNRSGLLSCRLLLAVCFFGAVSALAETFSFSSTDSYSASGTITAAPDPTTPGAYDVTSISGSVDGETITGLLPCAFYSPSDYCTSAGSGFLYDNVLYYPSPITFADGSSIGFSLSDGVEAAFYTVSTHNIPYFTTDVLHDEGNPIALNIVLTPEPSTGLLVATSLIAVLATSFHRRSNKAA